MKYLIVDSIEKFNDLQNRIHQHRLLNTPKYSAIKWAKPIYSLDGSNMICPIHEEDFFILNQNETPIEIASDDQQYFPPIKH